MIQVGVKANTLSIIPTLFEAKEVPLIIQRTLRTMKKEFMSMKTKERSKWNP